MTIWLTADWHLWHTNILDLVDRPFPSMKEMHETLVSNYIAVVKPEDTVYFLGDMTLAINAWTLSSCTKLLASIPGEKVLILGNHDKYKVWSYLKMGFTSVHTHYLLKPEMTSPLTWLVHDPKRALGSGFCGHVHNNWLTTQKPYPLVNVGVDRWDFKPVDLRTAMTELNALQR